MKRTYHLVHSEARARAARAVAEAPDGYVVTVSEPRRNREQNAALHALISEIAERREWAGQSWDVETWKRLLVSAWARATGQRVQRVNDVLARMEKAKAAHDAAMADAARFRWLDEAALTVDMVSDGDNQTLIDIVADNRPLTIQGADLRDAVDKAMKRHNDRGMPPEGSA